MKSGLIVYLTGGAELPEGLIWQTIAGKWALLPTGWNWWAPNKGFLKWVTPRHHLFTRGCGAITLLVAQAEHNRLQAVHPPMRLSG